jgi:hypothetical protein
MHGAAMTHGLFMKPGSISIELKTLYAYDSILFPLITDGRVGIHGQVNIKKYFIPGGQKPIDASLVDRVMVIVDKSLELQRRLGWFNVTTSHDPYLAHQIIDQQKLCDLNDLLLQVAPQQWKGDLVVGPVCSSSQKAAMQHILGPLQADNEKICLSSMYQKLREVLETKETGIHCRMCDPYVLS